MTTSFGWFATPSLPRGYASSAVADESAGGAPRPAPAPELADVGRLARRALSRAVRAARADLVPTPSGRLLDHLGAGAGSAAVAQERWAAYDQVNVQVGLDTWLAEPGREHELVGVVGAAHHELGLAALVAAGGQQDGLSDDADVTFLLTTNRADLLEPALASRPGRVDLAVELGLPDAAARRELLGLYRGALVVDDVLLDVAARRTGGVSAPFLEEVLRRSALHAADADVRAGDRADGPLEAASEHLQAALHELFDTRSTMTRAVLGAGGGEPQGFYA